MTYNLQPSYPNVSVLTTNDKAISVMYGRAIDGTIIPIRMDNTGAISLATGNILAFNSNASLGGSPIETLTVTGLLATDTILAVTQVTPGSVPTSSIVGYSAQANNSLTIQWTANEGPGAIVRVMVSR